MTDVEELRARMREAAEKAMAATSDNWFHGEYSDIEYAPPAGDENGAHWFPLADELAPAVCDYLIVAQPSAFLSLDAEITRLREELRKSAMDYLAVEGQAMMAHDRAEAAEAALSAERAEVERLRAAASLAERAMDDCGDLRGTPAHEAFLEALTKETPHAG